MYLKYWKSTNALPGLTVNKTMVNNYTICNMQDLLPLNNAKVAKIMPKWMSNI